MGTESQKRRKSNKENELGSRGSTRGGKRIPRGNRSADDDVEAALRARIRELEASAANSDQRAQDAEDKLEAALARRTTVHPPPAGAEDSIPCPDKPSKVPMRVIKAKMRVSKTEWNAIRASLRRNFGAACFERGKSWKEQRKDRIGAALAATDEEHPVLKMPRITNGATPATRRTRIPIAGVKPPNAELIPRHPSLVPLDRRALQPRHLPNDSDENDEDDDMMDIPEDEDDEELPLVKGKGVDPAERGGREH
ncbi:hypothetical protein MKEN_00838700 [Mycena kentingensis (nom. inval.)]|nr:hypothetical protein MKEN_00838700 [Mycena kentingensis (nom. inval.)]